MKITRDELRRAIAERLGQDRCLRCSHRLAQHDNRRQCNHCDCPSYVLSAPPDYSTSEEASADLLDAMLDDALHIQFIKQSTGQMLLWVNSGDHFMGANRRDAVLLAAQRWLEIEGELE